jgi:hypothetical protein
MKVAGLVAAVSIALSACHAFDGAGRVTGCALGSAFVDALVPIDRVGEEGLIEMRISCFRLPGTRCPAERLAVGAEELVAIETLYPTQVSLETSDPTVLVVHGVEDADVCGATIVRVEAVAPGEAFLVAYHSDGNEYDRIPFEVVAPDDVSILPFWPEEDGLAVGEEGFLWVMAFGEDGDSVHASGGFTFRVDSPDVAEIEVHQRWPMVRGLSPGATEFTAELNSLTAGITIAVTP